MVAEIAGRKFANCFAVNRYGQPDPRVLVVGVGATALHAFFTGVNSVSGQVGYGKIIAGEFGCGPGLAAVIAVPTTIHLVVHGHLHDQHVLGLFMHLVHVIGKEAVDDM